MKKTVTIHSDDNPECHEAVEMLGRWLNEGITPHKVLSNLAGLLAGTGMAFGVPADILCDAVRQAHGYFTTAPIAGMRRVSQENKPTA